MKKFLEKHKILFLTILTGIIGAVVFICIYGVEVLDVTKDGWLYDADDLTQHYMGWLFFRRADWTFPIGMFDTLSYPNYASIIFTDSIPLLAIIFKILSGILPETFQYFGMFGFLCYILQGVFAFTLLRKYIKNKFYGILGSIFFIISPYLLQRMFWHNALSSHFLILAALCMLAYREKFKDKPLKKVLYWNLILLLGVTIHMYFLPMLLIIMLCTFVVEFIEEKKSYKSSLLVIEVFVALALFIIYILGGFTSNAINSTGIRYYNINLNTFFNPQGYSSILQNLSTGTDGEYEAIGYLGVRNHINVFLISSIYIAK